MTLRLDVQWEEAEEVSSPELAATWARFIIFVGGDCLTVIEDTLASGYRNSIDVSVYPLAEWVADNWWFLTTPQAGRGAESAGISMPSNRALNEKRSRYSLASAGDGFPWPSLMLLPETGSYLLAQSVHRDRLQRVRFIMSGQYIVDFQETVYTLERFVDSVVRRLEDHGVEHTRLQVEWLAIQATPEGERDFCHAAAALGVDPYSANDQLADQILQASERVQDQQLLLDLLAGVGVSQLASGIEWLSSGLRALNARAPGAPSAQLIHLTETVGAQLAGTHHDLVANVPWETGYIRGRRTRDELSLDPTMRFDLSPYVSLLNIDLQSPGLVEGLARTGDVAPVTVTSRRRSGQSKRFVQARVLS